MLLDCMVGVVELRTVEVEVALEQQYPSYGGDGTTLSPMEIVIHLPSHFSRISVQISMRFGIG